MTNRVLRGTGCSPASLGTAVVPLATAAAAVVRWDWMNEGESWSPQSPRLFEESYQPCEECKLVFVFVNLSSSTS